MEDALEDGVLVKVGVCGRYTVIFTANLLHPDFEDKEKRIALVEKGLEMLKIPNPEDTEYMRLRVIKKDRIWVVADGNAITFMKPEDY